MLRIAHFGHFEVDLNAGRLFKRGLRIALREKSFQVLALLVQHAGEVVTREELRCRLWPADVFVDFENNLNAAVARLRQALGDSAEHPRFIETLPRHGYRFLAKVSYVAPHSRQVPDGAVRLIVLPVLNFSGDPSQEYFSDAMTDGIIMALGALAPGVLNVIARTTAMRYKGSPKDIARIGRELTVEYVVEGGVDRTTDGILLNVQLIRVRDQVQVFARRYQTPASGIVSLQDSAARDIAAHVDVPAVAEALRAAPSVREDGSRRPVANPAAYDEYLQGRFHLQRVSPDAFNRACKHLEAAIALDPKLALAHDSLAEVYWYLGYFGYMRPIDAFSKGVLHAIRALEIDGSLGETHSLLGQYHKLDYNWPEVEREMALALELAPASPVVRARYAFNALMPRGRLDEAVAELERALDVDPLSIYVRSHLGIVLVLQHDWEKAVTQGRQLLELDPHAYVGHLILGSCYREQRLLDDAIAAHRRAVELSGGAAGMIGWLGLSLAAGGRTTEARALLEHLHQAASERYVPPSSLAWIYLGLGEIDAAFEWLDRAVEARDQFMMAIRSYAFFDPIRGDPRFGALLRKMRLDA